MLRMNRSQSFFAGMMGLLLTFVVFVNWNILWRNDTHTNTIEALKQKNEELVSILKEQQRQLKHYEDSEQTYLTERRKCRESLKENGTALQSPAAASKEAAFRKALSDYAQLHRDIIAGKKDPRFVKCILLNGYGNVLQEAISCFIFALVSNRAVLFDVSPVEGYMPFREFFPPEKMPFDGYNFGVLEGRTEYMISRHDLLCVNYHEHSDKEWISIHLTYDYYAPNILSNPFHGEELLAKLPANYFQIIFKELFRLHDDIQADVDKYKREHFAPYNIGIQIRHPTNDKQGVKDHKGFPVPPLELYAQAAEQLSRFQTEVDYKEVSWFVATQNLDLIDALRGYYGEKKIISYNGTITTTFDSHSEGQRVSLITWWLLGECDDVVTTEASSYGTTAGARTGLWPVVCTHQKFCFRRLTQTPCQDTQFLAEQPVECLLKERKHPHQFLSSPENSCGYFKYQIYTSPEFSKDSWNL
eukprot:TRINITY_DN1965_c0_g1_i1.p1 TRINITY_DN1965_c0_g1~~TRINITY_DN1965_c0_g1_i1.p1  ORF type:complete len:472 (-),score=94.78 TRINITY_DN1965_c0_g1_i1:8-1423(-)